MDIIKIQLMSNVQIDSSNMQSYPMQIMNTLNLAKNSPSIQKYALTTQFI